MREIIKEVECGLGPERLRNLKRDPDVYQQFWLGVLEAFPDADLDRPITAFLIKRGYGAVDNMRRAERSRTMQKVCPHCGRPCGWRSVKCPRCGTELFMPEVRMSEYQEGDAINPEADLDLVMDLERFVSTLHGRERYVAKRWLLDRADLFYKNHLKQIAMEMGVTAVRVNAIKKSVRQKCAAAIIPH